MTAMETIPETGMADLAMPRFEDGAINLQELFRRMAEDIVNGVMAAEADQMCEATGNSRNGYRDRKLETCVGTLALRVPKLRSGSFFPRDVIERYQLRRPRGSSRGGRDVPHGYEPAKCRRWPRGSARWLSKDQVSAICGSLDADVAELLGRDLSELGMPLRLARRHLRGWCRDGRVASTAVVTAIGCDSEGSRHVLGLGVVDTESYDSWLSFLRKVRGRGVPGVRLVTSDAHEGLRRAVSGVPGAAWQRCVVHLVRDCCREARSRQLRKRVGSHRLGGVQAEDPAVVRAAYHVASRDARLGMLPRRRARVMEEAEPDAPGLP